MIRIAILSCAIAISATTRAQSIENVRATFTGGKVTIQYDIVGGASNQQYNLSVYGSHNNFSLPLSQVSGDVGKNISGGTGRKIEWNAEQELGPFKGIVTFRVRGELVVMPIAFKSFQSAIKKGKSATLRWEGGRKDESAKLELFKAGAKVSDLGETKNTGTYSWSVPKSLGKGAGYSVRITVGQDEAATELFSVKPNIPLVLKFSPLLALVAIPLLGGGDPAGDPRGPLPAPPGPN